ncbi:DNA translocase FtsK 4TM domain-containing protein [bacterium]|nr:DNA translocase FtsK 4TM domain-containing protein [bacterium]
MRVFKSLSQTDRDTATIPYLKILVGLILAVAMISHNGLDPSPLNLLWPSEGIHNWLGLPGALVSGFLFDLFGWSGFLLPILLLVFSHKTTISRSQAFFLDGAVIVLTTIGLAQLLQYPDGPLARWTGFLGTVSNIWLAQFPGKLITMLVVIGFILRYAKHYTVNHHFVTLLQQIAGILLLLTERFRGMGQQRINKLVRRLQKRFHPLLTILKPSLSSVRARLVRNWTGFTRKLNDRLLEINPYQRLPLEKSGEFEIEPQTDEISNELARRKLLRRTIEEFKKRTLSENA